MKVYGGSSGPIRPEKPNEKKPIAPANGDAGRRQTPSQVDRLDRVEISAAGRARAGGLTPVDPASPNRLAEIRQRVLQGAYEADQVLSDVAQRIVETGDI